MADNVLVAVENYPDLKGGVSLYYVHARNLSYLNAGISVTVLNFSTDKDYVIDNILVISENTFRKEYADKRFPVLLLHAANIKNHYRFLKKYGNLFSKYIFFFHGHEVLRCAKVYSKPYKYVSRNVVKEYAKDMYDIVKLWLWRNTFKKCYEKSEFVFVSQWMHDEFLRWVKLKTEYMKGREHIIYNCIGKSFETESYDLEQKKRYDFLSIRSNFDGSKYGVDVICNLARENPELKFCLIGKGNYFNYNKKPGNLEVVYKFLKHEEMIDYLNLSKCALIPTRTDAQGVMACEMATFGIPVITSDIPVCKEVFSAFDNVGYISNDRKGQKIVEIYQTIAQNQKKIKNEKYFEKHTTAKEITLLKKI